MTIINENTVVVFTSEELKDINKELTKSAKKYDYSKLPKDNP